MEKGDHMLETSFFNLGMAGKACLLSIHVHWRDWEEILVLPSAQPTWVQKRERQRDSMKTISRHDVQKGNLLCKTSHHNIYYASTLITAACECSLKESNHLSITEGWTWLGLKHMATLNWFSHILATVGEGIDRILSILPLSVLLISPILHEFSYQVFTV